MAEDDKKDDKDDDKKGDKKGNAIPEGAPWYAKPKGMFALIPIVIIFYYLMLFLFYKDGGFALEDLINKYLG